MSDVYIPLFIANLLIDYSIIGIFRRMLRDMYVGNHNRKSEQKLYNQQPIKNQITLNYIKPYLVKRYANDYDFYHRYYAIYCFSTIPQYIILACLFFKSFIPVIVSLIVKIILLGIFRIFKFPDGLNAHSIYERKKR